MTYLILGIAMMIVIAVLAIIPPAPPELVDFEEGIVRNNP